MIVSPFEKFFVFVAFFIRFFRANQQKRGKEVNSIDCVRLSVISDEVINRYLLGVYRVFYQVVDVISQVYYQEDLHAE